MSDVINLIIKIGALLGAISTIISVFVVCHKVLKKMENIDTSLKDNKMDILRLTIVSKDMPLDERVSAGEKYVESGGNGSVHALVDVLIEQYKKQLEKEGR